MLHAAIARRRAASIPRQQLSVPLFCIGAATVGGAGSVATMVLVRVQAKLEAPLAALRNLGGEVAISAIAEVTFFGKDQAGRDISAVGNIGVTFADWADPDDN